MSSAKPYNAAHQLQSLPERLLGWFDRHRRAMPWRETRDPYAIWLSETMLQQTQVATVIPYYHRFLQRFPTVADLAAAPLEEVLKLWAGLGYYRRARHLHAAAKAIVDQHGGTLPPTAAQLLELPGIGRYTAGAVASIAFDEPTPVLDGNVMRVLTRLLAIKEDIAAPRTQQKLWQIAGELVPARRAGDFNQAMMELGATVCTPGRPQCLLCPARNLCKAAALGIQEQLPVKKAKAAVPVVRRVALVLAHGSKKGRGTGRWLFLRRPGGVLWEHLWEFPLLEVSEGLWGELSGGQVREQGLDQISQPNNFNCLARIADVIHKRLSLEVTLDRWQASVAHTLTHRRYEVRVFRGKCHGEPVLPPCDAGRYEAFAWATWPPELPMSRLTHKIATAAQVGDG